MKTSRLFSLLLFLAVITHLSAAEPLRVFIRAGVKTHGPASNGLHDHPRFLADWTQLLKERGCQVDGAMDFPSAEQLEKTDVLVMFAADAGTIQGEKRQALEKFLSRGGGIVCFHDAVVGNDAHWFKTIIGGAWENGVAKWLEGPMSLYYVDQLNPITQGAANFDMDDEIYYDLHLQPEAKILAAAYTPKTASAARKDERGMPASGKVTVYDIQPQMWTYEREQWRAFVSIPGHRYEAFAKPAFRAVLLRGIQWAGKREPVDALCTPAELAALRYPEGGPSQPSKSLSELAVHPQFKMALVASEPLVNKAMNMDWDAQGRLWVVETPEYPDGRWANSPKDLVQRWVEGKYDEATGRYERPAHDKVSILTDTDGDGLMDKKEIFYEGLELVTSMVFHEDGVIVSQAPEILRLRDTDGDGRADRVEKLYTGLGTRDTHAVINNLRWGFDGWIYATHGYSSSDHVTNGDGSKDFGQIGSGVIRFKPDGSAIEQFSSKGGNTWGLQISWDNEVFWTQPTSGDLLMHVVLSEREIAQSRAARLPSFNVVQRSIRTFPIIPHEQLPYAQIDLVGRFTAAAGCVIYDGGAWPESWNYDYFTTEPTINLVHHEIVKPSGVSFTASKEGGREELEFIAGRDLWFRPIEVRVGPDGGLYVVDFYNQAVIHNDTRGPKHGPRNAAVRPDRDHYYGRIWRVDHREAKRNDVPQLAKADGAGCVKALNHPNQHVRMNAVRLLVENKQSALAPELRQLAAQGETAQARVASLWALARLGQLDEPTLQTAATAPDAAVRKNALMAAAAQPELPAGRSTALKLVQDPDPRVRLEALRLLAGSAVNERSAAALVGVYATLEDPWSRAAFMAAASGAPGLFLQVALARPQSTPALIGELTKRLTENASADDLARLVTQLASQPASMDPNKRAVLIALGSKPKLAAPAWSDDLKTALQKLVRSENAKVAAAALPLAVRWDSAGVLKPELESEIKELISQLKNTQLTDTDRADIAATLLEVRKLDAAILPAVATLLADTPPLQGRLVESLGALPDEEVGRALVGALPKLNTEAQAAALNQLFKRPSWSMALLDALEAGSIDADLLGPTSLHRLRLHADPKVAERANTIIDKARGPVAKQKDALLAELTPAVAVRGDETKGRALFMANCANCHRLGDLGAEVGPPLTGMGAHGADQLLVHIIDPNREVDPSFVACTVETKDGEIYDGVVTRENTAAVILRNAAGEQEIRKDNVASRRNSARSLMPEGFEALGREGLRDLLTFVCGSESRFRFLDLGRALTADTRQGMYRSLESSNERLHLAKRGIVQVEGVPFKIVDPAKSPGGFDAMVLKGGTGFAKTLPQKIDVKVGFAARALHFLGGVAGWGYPAVNDALPALKVTVHYAGGAEEEIVAHNGKEFADYIRVVDVPGSKLADGLVQGNQLRYYAKPLRGQGIIETITFESFDNALAPTTMAVTAELPAAGPETAAGATAAAAPAAAAGGGAEAAPAQSIGLKVLLVGGGSSHDFKKWYNQFDSKLLTDAGCAVQYTEDAAVAATELAKSDVVVISVNANGFDTPPWRKAVFDHAAAGKGLVILHPGAWYNYKDWPEYNRTIVAGGARGHDRLGPFKVEVLNKTHPVTTGVPAKFEITDELYHFNADPAGAQITVLAETSTSTVTKRKHPSVWIVEHPKARIVGIALGHDGSAHNLAAFQQILTNAVKWVGRKE